MKSRKKLSEEIRNDKGITLIALVITIIVLLILAAISIAILTGENGLLTKANDAKTGTEKAAAKEQVKLAVLASYGKNRKLEYDDLRENLNQIAGITGVPDEITESSFPLTVKVNEVNIEIDAEGNVVKGMPIVTTPPTTAVTENTKFQDPTSDNKIAVIPKGFAVSSVTGENTEQSIDRGLVVIDGKENQWVWVPVDDIREWVIEAPNTPIPGTNVTATTNRYSQLYDFNSSGKTKKEIGLPSYPIMREPDIVTGASNGTGLEYDAQYYNTVLSRYTNDEYCTSLDMFAKQLSRDYNDMMVSVAKYHGFYIGRYELTGSIFSPTEAPGVSITKQNWYDLYNACSNFSNDEVFSTMIWGTQWDMTMEFVSTRGNKKPVDFSESWGNYRDSDVYNSEGTSIIKASGTSSKLNTGITTYTMGNNIYDLAGNCSEYTLEAHSMIFRALRGCYYSYPWSSEWAAAERTWEVPTHNDLEWVSSRATLYLKVE